MGCSSGDERSGSSDSSVAITSPNPLVSYPNKHYLDTWKPGYLGTCVIEPKTKVEKIAKHGRRRTSTAEATPLDSAAHARRVPGRRETEPLVR
jgi:hypothetical protein